MINIRPIRAADENLYRSILDRTSDEDRYCRFFHTVNHFDPTEIRRFVEPAADLLGFIAIEDDHALGAVHACFLADGTAELAIVVAKDARRRGVARRLVLHLIQALNGRGCPRLIAYALAENHAMSRLARGVGMTAGVVDANVTVWTLGAPSLEAA